jgi:hypothetical protein
MVGDNFFINSYLKNNIMKIKALFMAIFFVAAIFGGCEKSNDVFQEDDYSTLKKKPVERPFKIHGTSVSTTWGDPCGPNGEYKDRKYEGKGNASHMGRVTYTGVNCNKKPCLEGRVTVTAANGDILILVGGPDYTICPVEPPRPKTMAYAGAGYIDGGTGRFEHATGTIEWYLVLDLDRNSPGFGTVDMNAEGTIVY